MVATQETTPPNFLSSSIQHHPFSKNSSSGAWAIISPPARYGKAVACTELAGWFGFGVLDDVQLLNSAQAIEEAKRNLETDRPEGVPRLKRLLESVSTVDAPQGLTLPATIRLEPKGQPILLAAIHGKADYLLTGDARHFEHLYGKRIEGVLVLRLAQYFERRRRH